MSKMYYGYDDDDAEYLKACAQRNEEERKQRRAQEAAREAQFIEAMRTFGYERPPGVATCARHGDSIVGAWCRNGRSLCGVAALTETPGSIADDLYDAWEHHVGRCSMYVGEGREPTTGQLLTEQDLDALRQANIQRVRARRDAEAAAADVAPAKFASFVGLDFAASGPAEKQRWREMFICFRTFGMPRNEKWRLKLVAALDDTWWSWHPQPVPWPRDIAASRKLVEELVAQALQRYAELGLVPEKHPRGYVAEWGMA